MPKSEQHMYIFQKNLAYLFDTTPAHTVWSFNAKNLIHNRTHREHQGCHFCCTLLPGIHHLDMLLVFGYLVFYSLLFCLQNSRLFVMSFSKRSNGQLVAEQVYSRTSGSSQKASLQAPPSFINAKF